MIYVLFLSNYYYLFYSLNVTFVTIFFNLVGILLNFRNLIVWILSSSHHSASRCRKISLSPRIWIIRISLNFIFKAIFNCICISNNLFRNREVIMLTAALIIHFYLGILIYIKMVIYFIISLFIISIFFINLIRPKIFMNL